jgi:hypothetical protein
VDLRTVMLMPANTVLLLSCAYEAWAIRILSGQLVKRRLHILTSVGIILICSITVFLASPYRRVLFTFCRVCSCFVNQIINFHCNYFWPYVIV